jgi:acetoin utilization deacetylase AcuC-like enzyme
MTICRTSPSARLTTKSAITSAAARLSAPKSAFAICRPPLLNSFDLLN